MDTPIAPVGLSLLNQPMDAVIDIVFVHGLRGHPQKTWSSDPKLAPSKVSKRDKIYSLFSNHKSIASGNSVNEDYAYKVQEKRNEEVEVKEVFWPRDLLKADFPRARIMTFGYNTNITHGYAAANQGNIFSHARDLLYALEAKRRQAPNRDLVFIAHSLGGILVKEVLRRSEADPDLKITKIFESTIGVFFFGTPHRGSRDWASFGAGIASIASHLLGVDINTQVIHALLPTGPELELCRESFTNQWVKRGDKLTVRTFQESKGVTGIRWGGFNQLIVPPDSSTLDHPSQRARTIEADHIEMVKFSGENNKAYEMVKEDIEELVLRAEEKERNQKGHILPPAIDLMSSLVLPNITERPEWQTLVSKTKIPADDIFERLSDYDYQRVYRWRRDRKLENTTGWILKHPYFLVWLSGEGPQCLWLSGIVGCGKSIIMTTVIEAAVAKARSISKPVLQFIYDHSFRRYLTARALFESYTKQLLVYIERSNKSCPSAVIARILAFYGPNRRRPDVQELIVEVLIPLYQMVQGTGATFLVDGIDECSRQEIQEILRGLRQLLRSCLCRVFICCREEVNVLRGLPGTNRIWITAKDTKADLEVFVDSEIERMQYDRPISSNEAVLNSVRHEILNKADGMFLWVKYQIKMIWEECTGGESTDEAVYETLKRLPKDLNETYQKCLEKVNMDSNRKSLTDRILKWICVSLEPFKIIQLQEALAVNPDTGELEQDLIHKEEIMTCCASLAYLENDNSDELVLLAHHSVRQFLFPFGAESAYRTAQSELGELCVIQLYRDQRMKQLTHHAESSSGPIGTTLPIPRSYGTTIISTIAPVFFASPPLSSRSSVRKPVTLHFPKPPVRNVNVAQDTGFLSYAKNNWMVLTSDLPRTSRCWSAFKNLALPSDRSWDIYPWEQRGYNSLDSHVFQLYGWSIINSHYPLFSLAISQRGIVKHDIFNLPLYDHVGQQAPLPLFAAASTGDIRIVEPLLEITPKVNEQYSYALYTASLKGHLEVVQLLLKAGTDVNARVGNLDSALQAAWCQGHYRVVQCLMNAGADFNVGTLESHADKTGVTANFLEKRPDESSKQTYLEGVPQPEVDEHAPIPWVGLTFLPGADKSQVMRLEMNNLAKGEPDQKDAMWRANTAASLLMDFEVLADLSVVQRYNASDVQPFLDRTKGLRLPTQRPNSRSQANHSTNSTMPKVRGREPITIDSDFVKIVYDLHEHQWDLQSTLIEVDRSCLLNLIVNYKHLISCCESDLSFDETKPLLDIVIEDARRLCVRSPVLFRMSTRGHIIKSKNIRYGISHRLVFRTLTTSQCIKEMVSLSASIYSSLDSMGGSGKLIRPRFLQMIVILLLLLNNDDLAEIADFLEATYGLKADRKHLEMLFLKVIPLSSINSKVFLKSLTLALEGWLPPPEYIETESWDIFVKCILKNGYLLPGTVLDLGREEKSWIARWSDDGFKSTLVFNHLQYAAKGCCLRSINDIPPIEVDLEPSLKEVSVIFTDGETYTIEKYDLNRIARMIPGVYNVKKAHHGSRSYDLMINELHIDGDLNEAIQKTNTLIRQLNLLSGYVKKGFIDRVFHHREHNIRLLSEFRNSSHITKTTAELQGTLLAVVYKTNGHKITTRDAIETLIHNICEMRWLLHNIDHRITEISHKNANKSQLRAEMKEINNLINYAEKARNELNESSIMSNEPIVKVLTKGLGETGAPVWFDYEAWYEPSDLHMHLEARRSHVQKFRWLSEDNIEVTLVGHNSKYYVTPLQSVLEFRQTDEIRRGDIAILAGKYMILADTDDGNEREDAPLHMSTYLRIKSVEEVIIQRHERNGTQQTSLNVITLFR